MRVFIYQLRRMILSKWFLLSVACSVATLWLSMSDMTTNLIDMKYSGYIPEWEGMLRMALLGSFSYMTLPALSALPCGANALTELLSGSMRNAVFRMGKQKYCFLTVLLCAISGMLLQLVSFVLIVVILNSIAVGMFHVILPPQDLVRIIPNLLYRIMAGGAWATLGSIVALLTRASSAAYVAPLCASYALMMIITDFFPSMIALHPIHWLENGSWALPVFFLINCLLMSICLGREMKEYA